MAYWLDCNTFYHLIIVPCSECFTGGILTIGGLPWVAPPEFIDPRASMHLCKDPSPFPSVQGIIDSVGTYIGNSMVLLCGGMQKHTEFRLPNISSSCERLVGF